MSRREPYTIAIVRIPIPERSPEAALASAVKTAPTYRAMADRGLLRKDYLNGSEGGGGVYVWNSREEAEAWYTDEWRARLTAQFGAEPSVTYYQCSVTVDNLAGETIVRDPGQEHKT